MTTNKPRGASLILIIGVSLFLVGYVSFQSRNFIKGPKITITSPEEGVSLEDNLIVIKGEAQRISYLSLNDRQIFVNEKGEFEETLLGNDGYTILSLKASDRFGRETEVVRTFVSKKQNTFEETSAPIEKEIVEETKEE